jgi:hypothetical protein
LDYWDKELEIKTKEGEQGVEQRVAHNLGFRDRFELGILRVELGF